MVDRSKELYQQQLAAHAAWANFGASSYPGATHGSPFGAPGSGASTNPYQDYVQRLQQLSGQLGHNNPGMFSSNFLGNSTKDMSGFPSPIGFPPGHPMHFPSLGSYNPLATQSPTGSLSAHIKSSSTTPSTPLPAHMRSSPYSQTSYHPSPYSTPYSMPGYGASQSPPVHINQTHYGVPADQARRQVQTPLHNGSSSTSMSSFIPSGATSAYTQLLHSAAFSRAPSNHEESTSKKSSPVLTTANNNYPHISLATTTTASSYLPTHSQLNTRSRNQQSCDDQVAAALLDSFGGQFNNQFMSEMVKTAKVSPVAPAHSASSAAVQITENLREKEIYISKKTPTVVARASQSTSPQQDFSRTANSTPETGDSKSEMIQNGNDVENQSNRSSVNTNTAVHNSSRPGPHPSHPASMSITNKIKDLERKLASTSTSRQTSTSTLSNDDRSELKGLWKMQANIFKQKLQSTSTSQDPPYTSQALVAPIAPSDQSNITSSTSAAITVSSHIASPRVSARAAIVPARIPEPEVPQLLHTPRSPPQPPPPLKSFNNSQTSPYANNPPPYSASCHTPQYLPRTQGPSPPSNYEPSVPSSSQDKSVRTVSESMQLSIQNDRMEVKNSGIPGPSAISWKRKSAEDSLISGNLSKKRRPYISDTRGNRDPFSFEDDSDKSRDVPGQTEIYNDITNGSGVDLKMKSFSMPRDNDVESDESSMSRSSSPAKMKKRPKMEEWSVNKDKKNTSFKSERQRSKDELVVTDHISKKSSRSNNKSLGEIETIPEKNSTHDIEKSFEDSSTKSSISNAKVWLQAFGASNLQKQEVIRDSTLNAKKISEIAKEPIIATSTILEIPPEVRRKPRPKFGGLIHFDPDWNRGVRRHHERCRVPSTIENSAFLKPKILAGHQTPKKSYEDQARKAMVSPPNMILLEKERLEKAALNVAHKLPTYCSNDDELSGELPSIVETILENRKKLREATGSRIYKVPFMKEKKKRMMRAPVHTELKNGPIGLLPTPGLPLFTNDTKDVLLGTGFGNFRYYTLDNFIQKGKITELLACNTRRHTHNSKSVLSIKEIFGHETKKTKSIEENRISDEDDDKSRKEKKVDESKEREMSVDDKVKEEAQFREDKHINLEENLKITSSKLNKKEKKGNAKRELSKSTALQKTLKKMFSPKFRASKVDNYQREITEDDFGYSHEVGNPSESEKNLQFDLGAFALDLLEDNPSWSKQVAIQNLVIWEPTEPEIPEQSKKKKSKKKRVRKSGMDFQSNKKKSKNIVVSIAGSLDDGGVYQVVYSIDNVIGESSRWVIDKNAGETILHRASKMGYPDVAAYALDMADMAAGDRDYAGLTPLHKAALRGNFNVARILLCYGADPGAGIKGTRALHEAIEGGESNTAWVLLCYGADPLLHDYSGNMPVDLATDRTMQQFFTNIMADLHGKVPPRAKSDTRFSTTQLSRWNVTHCSTFHTPPSGLLNLNQEEKMHHIKKEAFMFEASSHIMPTLFKLKDQDGEWILYRDIRDHTKRCGMYHEDIRKKGKLIEMKKSDFLKHSHCLEMDQKKVEVRFHERSTEDIVILVKADKFIRQVLNSNITEVS